MIKNKIILIAFLSFTTFSLSGQNGKDSLQITLDEMLKILNKNNIEIKNAYLNTQLLQKEKKTAGSFDPVDLSWEYGQINSNLKDNYFSIDQNINNPVEIVSKNKYYNNRIRLNEYSYDLTILEKEQQLYALYYEYLWLENKKRIMADQLKKCNECLSIVNLKYKTGETGFLSNAFSELRFEEINLELSKIDIDLNNIVYQLNNILLSDTLYIPAYKELKRINLSIDTNHTSTTISLYLDQKLNTASAEIKYERSKLYPDFQLGFFHQEIDRISGFSGISAGINFPLLFFNKRAAVKRAGIKHEITENEVSSAKKTINNRISSIANQLFLLNKHIDKYENELLDKAESIAEKAHKLYINGEIDYIEYLDNIKQSITIKNNYYDIINEYNQKTIEINYLKK